MISPAPRRSASTGPQRRADHPPLATAATASSSGGRRARPAARLVPDRAARRSRRRPRRSAGPRPARPARRPPAAARTGRAGRRGRRAAARPARRRPRSGRSIGTSRSAPVDAATDPVLGVDHLHRRGCPAGHRHRVRQPPGVHQGGDLRGALCSALGVDRAPAACATQRSPAAGPGRERHPEQGSPTTAPSAQAPARRPGLAAPTRGARYPRRSRAGSRRRARSAPPAGRTAVDLAAQVADVHLDDVRVALAGGSQTWSQQFGLGAPPRRPGASGTPAARTPAASARSRRRPGSPGAWPGPARGRRRPARPAAAARRGAAARAAGPPAPRTRTAWSGSRRRRVQPVGLVVLAVLGREHQHRHPVPSARSRSHHPYPDRPGSMMSRIIASYPPSSGALAGPVSPDPVVRDVHREALGLQAAPAARRPAGPRPRPPATAPHTSLTGQLSAIPL